MKTSKKSRGFTKSIISLCKSASLLLMAAALTVSMGSSLTAIPDKAFAADRPEEKQRPKCERSQQWSFQRNGNRH